MHPRTPWRALRGWTGAVMALATAAAFAQPPALPVERQTVATLPPPDASRLYVADVAFNHLIDGRLHVIDGQRMRYLGMLGTGFAGQSTLSRDRREIYVATTYYSRLQRGERTDVVEIYGSDDLALKAEVVIPPKHAQAISIRAMMATTGDSRFLLVQNATPASSVTVVDTQQRRFVAEIPTPGCWGAIAWPGVGLRRFSTVCGDGTLVTLDLDEQGRPAGRSASARFFDPDTDPVFMHFELDGLKAYFTSFAGKVHPVVLAGDAPRFETPWSLVGPADAKARWAPSGYQLFTLQPELGRLYVSMHDQAAEGTHKTPAKQIWVYDLATQRRIARLPGRDAVAMIASRQGAPRLYLLDGVKNELLAYDTSRDAATPKSMGRFPSPGESPIFLELH